MTSKGPAGEASPDAALEGFYAALLDDDAEALYERAPCGYLSTTPEGTIVKVNQTFLAFTGYSRSELVGRKTFASLLTAGGRIYHETHYAPMLQMQGSAREIALDLVCADGRRLPVLVNSLLEQDDEGRPLVVRTAVFDATDRRAYERELVRAKESAEESERRATLLARTLQQTLIPPSPPEIPHLDAAGAYRPAGDGGEVGGDFFDVFEVGPDDWVVALGDVRGKGAEAAVVTALARYTIRAAAMRHESPSAVLQVLNHVMRRDGTDRFCTVVLARLRRDGPVWRSKTVLAGHPLPLVRRADGTTGPAGRPGQLLGVFDDPKLHDFEGTLRSGDVALLFTDGVTEGRRDGEFYGDDRLVGHLRDRPESAQALADAIVEDVVAFQAGVPRDDIAVVVLRVP